MVTWFTSDPHFGDKTAAKKRGFSSVKDHDQTLDENYRKCLKPGDDVWWLGDLAVCDNWWSVINQMIRTLPGSHHLVLGNHDRGHPLFEESWRCLRSYYKVFDSVQLYSSISSFGGGGTSAPVLLSHFPYYGDVSGKEDRYVRYRLRNSNSALIHGHTHSSQKVTYTPRGVPMIHVGVDAWEMKPVHQEYIACELKAYWGMK